MRLVSLGDSFSCGEGVGLQLDLSQTWVGLIAASRSFDWTPLAVAGARTRDLRAVQLPAALAARADVATVLVGLNDVVRAGFDPSALANDLRAVVGALRAQGCLVLLARLHDPGAVLPLPRSLRRGLAVRVAAVHAAVDALATDPGVHVVDLGAVPALRQRCAWAADRIHPAATGHRAMAVAAAEVLSAAGIAVTVPAVVTVEGGPSALAQLRWFVAHGLPWLASHLRSVALPVLAIAAGVSPRRAR